MRKGVGFERMVHLSVLVGIFAFSVLCFSEGNGICQPNGGPQGMVNAVLVAEEITFEGSAKLESGEDPSQGMQRALHNAEDQALLDGARPLIHPVVFSRERAYLLKVLRPRKNEVLAFVEPVSEGLTEDGVYRVIIRAGIRRDRTDRIGEMLAANLPAKRIIVMTADRTDGRPSKGHIFQDELAGLLKKKGYETIDPKGMTDDKSRRFITLLRRGDREAPKLLGLYFLAATIMEGSMNSVYSQETSNIFSSRSQGSLRIYRAGKEPASFAVKDIKGFGSDEKKSGLDAESKGSAILAARAVKSISEKERKK